MPVHLLIVDALNLIRRIHAVQGTPCVDTCLHALEQLLGNSQPTHAVAVFDDEARAQGWRHQLLRPEIRIRDYFQKRWLDAPFIEDEFGVAPGQLADFWGLTGISSSKIPGVAGIGPKSATQLINDFGTLEALYERLDEVPEKWRKKLEAHRESAFICRDVATLKTDLQLDGNLQQLRLKG